MRILNTETYNLKFGKASLMKEIQRKRTIGLTWSEIALATVFSAKIRQPSKSEEKIQLTFCFFVRFHLTMDALMDKR